MVNKEFISVAYTALQMSFATAIISANHKQDYRVIGNTECSITFLCRTGYHWSTISEIKWQTKDEELLDYQIICSLNPETSVTKHMLQEYAEKHISRLAGLITDYVKQSQIINPQNANKKKWGFL